MLNTLKYAKDMEDAGFTRDQAETYIQIMSEIIETKLATKQNILDLRNEMQIALAAVRNEILSLRTELQNEIQSVRAELRSEIQSVRVDMNNIKIELENKIVQSEYRLTIKLGTIVSVAIGVAVILTKLI